MLTEEEVVKDIPEPLRIKVAAWLDRKGYVNNENDRVCEAGAHFASYVARGLAPPLLYVLLRFANDRIGEGDPKNDSQPPSPENLQAGFDAVLMLWEEHLLRPDENNFAQIAFLLTLADDTARMGLVPE